MKQLLLSGALLCALSTAAQAACFVEYKAKQDSPLRLHYGVIEIAGPDCPDRDRAAEIVAERLDGTGWQMLTLLSATTDAPSAKQRKEAGDFFLRY